MIVAFNDFDVLVETEDAARQQERLRHVIEQSAGDVLDAELDRLRVRYCSR